MLLLEKFPILNIETEAATIIVPKIIPLTPLHFFLFFIAKQLCTRSIDNNILIPNTKIVITSNVTI